MSAERKNILWLFGMFFVLLCSVAKAEPAKDAKAEPAKDAKAEPAKDAKAEPAKDAKEDPAVLLARAEKAMGRGDVKEALELLIKAAEMNYTPAQVYFAEYLDYSEYDEDAVGWFMTAAFQGNANAAFGLAKMYAVGEGVEKSNAKAFYWFKFAADRNHLGAVRVMALAYRTGQIDQAIDLEQAKFWESKIPELEKAEKRMLDRKSQLEEKEIAEERKKAKEIQEELNKKFIEARALEEAAKKAAEGAALGGAGQGATK